MKSKLLYFGLFGLIVCVLLLWIYFSNGVDKTKRIYLNNTTPIEIVMDSLNQDGVLKNKWIFDFIANARDLKEVPKGSYLFKAPISHFDLVSKLKHGFQDPVSYTLSTATFINDIAGKAGAKMEFDSIDFMNYILDTVTLQRYGLNSDNVMTLFLPNTYDFYWTTSIAKFVTKFGDESNIFWNSDRKSKAQKLNLTPIQAYILASLVQKEYARKDERSKIASVLINRLNQNIPLQVDATAKYATRDFTAKRVLNAHTRFQSPYNTYLHTGLPPGPICVPELSTIDAVLNPIHTDYLYYCADPSLNGYHIFSKTLAEHEAVATTYRNKMNELGVKK